MSFQLVKLTDPIQIAAGNVNNNYLNTIQVDQSGGTGDVYGVLGGTLNGVNTTFTVSNAAYDSGSLMVFLNGVKQIQGTAEDYVETTPASGTFDFITAPEATDEITVIYVTQSVTVAGYLQERTLQSKSADYTLLGTDSGTLVDANGGAVTITLPAANTMTNLTYHIKKTDATTNSVIVDGNGSETIDGGSTATLTNQYESITIISDGSAWWVI